MILIPQPKKAERRDGEFTIGYGSYLAKSVVNQLIAQKDKSFQIAVEDSNVGAKRLYEKIGFVKQTQVVYLKQKG